MGLLQKIFGTKETEERNNRGFDTLSEEEKIQIMLPAVTELIRVNAEGDDGNPEYQLQYGIMFATGKGPYGHGTFSRDLDEALYWLNRSAAQGNTDAMCMIGRVYQEKGDLNTAFSHFRKAAENDNIVGCEEVAMAYSNGKGVPEDKAKAHKWYLKAAEMGSDFAQYIVGVNYDRGDGVAENVNEAVKWFMAAADKGQPNAQYRIGEIYEFGGNDQETACQWYAKAAEQGNKEAIKRLSELGKL